MGMTLSTYWTCQECGTDCAHLDGPVEGDLNLNHACSLSTNPTFALTGSSHDKFSNADRESIIASNPSKDLNDCASDPDVPHYKKGGYQVKDIQAVLLKDYDGYVAFCLGNVVKYIYRGPHKGDMVGDFKKAADYLQFALEELDDV